MSDKDEMSMEQASNDTSMDEAVETIDELALLKQRADLIGVKYGANIGIEKLKAKIQEKLESDPSDPAPQGLSDEEFEAFEAYDAIADEPTRTVGQSETAADIRMKRRQAALRLVRVRVTNMNPLKSGVPGDIFSVGNSEIGFIKKFVPYNCATGYHIPQIILDHLRERQYMTHYDVKIGNKTVTKNKLVPEMAIEVLPPLTAEEFQELKQRQLMAAGKSSDQ